MIMSTPITKSAYIFPGQGSQSLGMGKPLAQAFQIARDTFDQADEVLGFSLSKLVWEGPEDEINDTINTQPALLAHSIAALNVLKEVRPDIQPQYVAGHSMGEFSALVSAGSLSYSEALKLVRTRGKLMKSAGEASPGGMAAVLGLDIETLEQICIDSSNNSEIVQIANDNCPGQVVISGSGHAIDRAMESALDAGARKVIRLKVSIPAHSVLMNKAQSKFAVALEEAPLIDPIVPIIGNVSAKLLKDKHQIRLDLQDQLQSRVRWTETIQFMLSRGVTTFLEIGSGSVLTGLLRRIDRKANGIQIGIPEDLTKLPSD
jgi:[acyl-carrier-protein] S-malonyltransferase